MSRVLVVDNGSRDGTAAAARAAGAQVVVEPRRGYGQACLTGIAQAPEAEVFLFLDGDGSDDPRQAADVLAPILSGAAELVVGSRRLGGLDTRSHPWHAIAGTRFCVGLLNLLSGARATDLGPFRAVRAEALARLGMRDRDYGWTVEMQIKAARAGYASARCPWRIGRGRAGAARSAEPYAARWAPRSRSFSPSCGTPASAAEASDRLAGLGLA